MNADAGKVDGLAIFCCLGFVRIKGCFVGVGWAGFGGGWRMVDGRGPLSTSCLSPRLSIADLAIAWLVGDIQFVYILFWGRGRRGVLGVVNMDFWFCFMACSCMGCVDLVMSLVWFDFVLALFFLPWFLRGIWTRWF